MSLCIRRALVADIPEIIPVYRASMAATYVGATPELTIQAIEDHLSGDWEQRKLGEFTSYLEADRSIMRVARLGGAVAGFGFAHRDRRGGGLYVGPEHQGGMVGAGLLYGIAQELGVDEDIYLSVVVNTPAVTFYKRLGFVSTDVDLYGSERPKLRNGQEWPLIPLVLPAAAARLRMGQLQRLQSMQC